MLKNVPHFLFGQIQGTHELALYVLFPHLHVAGDKFVSLTHHQLSRWVDRIFLPAVHRYCEADYIQHIPASFEHTLCNYCARQVEDRLVDSASYNSRRTLSYFIDPKYLEPIWTDILNTIANTRRFRDFRNAQLFFATKETKLQFKISPSRLTLLNVLKNFEAYFKRIINLNFVYLDRFHVDIGKEIFTQVSFTPLQRLPIDLEAQVYL